MKNLTDFSSFKKLHEDRYEDIMQNMVDEVDIPQIEASEEEITKLKDKIETKKEELDTQLTNLENLEVETFTEDNQEIVEKKKIEITELIEKLKEEISSFEESIETLKDKLISIKGE